MKKIFLCILLSVCFMFTACQSELEKREEALMEERHALKFAKNQGREEERNSLIAKWKSKGYTDEQIQDLLS